MGPPPRPSAAEKPVKEEKERITDIDDISDAIFGSGVDLREEENYLSNTLHNVHGHRSYGATLADGKTKGYGALSHADLANLGKGALSTSTSTQDALSAEVERKHRAAATTYAKRREQHLRHPFLSGNTVRHRMRKIALDQGVTLDVKGLYEDPPQPRPTSPAQPIVTGGMTMTGKDTNGVAAVQTKPQVYLDETSRYADMLSLLSIAANEQIRTLLDDAYTLVRGRRHGSHAIVPPDLKALVRSDNTSPAAIAHYSVTDTAWDHVPTSQPTQPVETISITPSLATHLQNLAIADRDAEQARIRKRADRAKRLAAAGDSETPNHNTPNASGDGTPQPPSTPSAAEAESQIAPSSDKPLTKKERDRQAKMGLSEETLHKNANVTAAMALGFGKKKAKKYNWMTGAGGAASAPSNPFARSMGGAASTSLFATEVANDGPQVAKSKGPDVVRERKWGAFKEDGVQGQGIQMRDWALALQGAGHAERRAREKCLLALDRAAVASRATA